MERLSEVSARCLVGLVLLTAACGQEEAEGRRDVAEVAVLRVVDGDTIRVRYEGRSQPVRYIGMDTPETRHSPRGPEAFGDAATEANRRLVGGRTVALRFDVERRDRYGRLLAYVYLPDGTFVNGALVERGYAQVLTVPPNVAQAETLRALERDAREAGRGLWGER